jgi:hypothetical protein
MGQPLWLVYGILPCHVWKACGCVCRAAMQLFQNVLTEPRFQIRGSQDIPPAPEPHFLPNLSAITLANTFQNRLPW